MFFVLRMPPPNVICPDYRDFVRRETANRTQLDVDELVDGLRNLGTREEAKALMLGQATYVVDELVDGLRNLGTREEAKALMLGQATLARSNQNVKWLQRCRDKATGLAEPEWLDTHLWRRRRQAGDLQRGPRGDIGLHVDPRIGDIPIGGPRLLRPLSPASTVSGSPRRSWLPTRKPARAPIIWDTDEFPALGGAKNKESPQGVTENRRKSLEGFPALGGANNKEGPQCAVVNKRNSDDISSTTEFTILGGSLNKKIHQGGEMRKRSIEGHSEKEGPAPSHKRVWSTTRVDSGPTYRQYMAQRRPSQGERREPISRPPSQITEKRKSKAARRRERRLKLKQKFMESGEYISKKRRERLNAEDSHHDDMPIVPRPATIMEPLSEDSEGNDKRPITVTIPTSEVAQDQPCPLSGCLRRVSSIRQHVLQDHAPGIFREDLEPTYQVCRERYAALDILAKKLKGTTIEGLLSFLNELHLFSADQPTSIILPEVEIPLRHLCQVREWPVLDRFTLAPLNSPAVLTHWRILTHILSMMMPSEVEDVARAFGDPRRCFSEESEEEDYQGDLIVIDSIEEERMGISEGTYEGGREASSMEVPPVVDSALPEQTYQEVSEEGREAPLRELPPAFDSHFHLDRTRKTLGLHNRTTIRDLQRIIGPAPREKEVAVSGCIAVFCDPDRYGYPSSVEIDYLQKNGISVAIGMHPKSRLLYQDQWTDFCRALSTPGVVALGEIGLDFTLPIRATQEDRLENLLGHVTGPLQVVVVHCRGERKDHAQVDVNLKCLDVFKRAKQLCKLSASQRIHLHCFGSTPEIVDKWRQEFPNTFFGFTNMVESFSRVQLEGLQMVPNDKILLETDGPYFQPRESNYKINAPHLLGFTASHVARARGQPVEEILSLTSQNAEGLYLGTVEESRIPGRLEQK